MTENFRYTFKLERLKIDNREFRQDSDSFTPHTPLYVSVDLPRENQYVLNLSEISVAELSSDNKDIPEPVLTSKGFFYVKQQLESGFELPKIKPSDDWDEAVKTEKALEPSKEAPEDWGNTTDPFEKEADKLVSETWSDEEEKW